MREDRTESFDSSTAHRDGAPDVHPTLTLQAHQSNGFTAVNGDIQGASSARPDVSAKEFVAPQPLEASCSRMITPTDTYHSHGWRPNHEALQDAGSAHSFLREGSPQRKRKRSISVNVDHEDSNQSLFTGLDERALSKRRMHLTLDSAIDLTSPVTNLQSAVQPVDRQQTGPASIGPYARERSPVSRWNSGRPPPRPRPETEALLAESVNKFHQTQQNQEASTSERPLSRQATSPLDDGDQQEANVSADEEVQGDNPNSRKQRKRNFSNRTKTGCHTCRIRKKKCDERKPTCGNCERGNFTCQGYGPKPANGTKAVSTRVLHVQPKGQEAPDGSGGFFQSPSDDAGLSYSHWGRVPTAERTHAEPKRSYAERGMTDPRYPPPSRDSWHRHGWQSGPSPASQFQDRLPPPDYPHAYHSQHLPPPPHPSQSSGPYDLGPADPYRRPSNGPPTVVSSQSGSAATHSSQHAAHLALSLAGFQPSEKDKMLRGQPFLHWLDNFLIGERESCSVALERFNKGSRSDGGLTREAKADLFSQILDPAKRINPGGQGRQQQPPGPVGTVQDHTIVESPFKCEYGYNIHLGSATVLQAGCYLQDAADISIGDRVIIGSDVKIHCLTASVESNSRAGSQGHVVAGAVAIEDDVFIGANSIILPYCTIGRGAVVGAGSVVTRDVKENTVVAGVPAKFIRSINSGDPGNFDRHHAYEIEERNERVKKRMVAYANSGFNRYSPRMI